MANKIHISATSNKVTWKVEYVHDIDQLLFNTFYFSSRISAMCEHRNEKDLLIVYQRPSIFFYKTYYIKKFFFRF